MPRHDQAEFLEFTLKGDTDAINFCTILFGASQVLDDLIDKDKEVTDDELIETFWSILIDLPMNSFYRQNVDTLVPMMQVFLQDWEDATKMEKTPGGDFQNIAYVLRDTVGAIVTHVAGMVGGRVWQKAVAVSVRNHIFEETLEDYKTGLNK